MSRDPPRQPGAKAYRITSRFVRPPAEFANCFTTFYRLELEVADDGEVTDYMHPEWGSIRFFAGSRPTASIGRCSLAGARYTAVGPSSLPARFAIGSTQMWGIGFLPLGWARLVGEDASALANFACDGSSHPAFERFAPLSELLCDPAASEQKQLGAISELMGKLMRPTRDDDTILRVHANLIDSDITGVAEFASRSGISTRTLERITRRYFGFSPKLLLRRQRFMRSLAQFMLHRGTRWTEAMDGLYHDQAQFSREFREFMGMSPSEYAAMDRPFIDSFMEARARQLGSAAQTLDAPR